MMDHVGAQQTESGMAMLVVVPGEELLTEGATVLNGTEAVGELRSVLHGAELAFGIGIVIGDVRTTVGFGNA